MLAEDKQPAKVLSKAEQKHTIKGAQKPKKNILKNYLESPFALEWPTITPEHEEDITALLRKCSTGLHKLDCKPPWKEVAKYKGDERKVFLSDYRRRFQENLDPEHKSQNEKATEARSHLILGYNAVMRSLENNRIAGIIVKKNVQPSFITKAFLPGCANKCIPLVPLSDLEEIVKDKETLGLTHACMVLGLKPSVREATNVFHPLLCKMCEALGIEEEEEESEAEEAVEGCGGGDNTSHSQPEYSTQHIAKPQTLKLNHCKLSYRLSDAEINSYYLKRTGKKRAFIPGSDHKKTQAKSGSDSDFLSFGGVDKNLDAQTQETQDRHTEKPSGHFEKKQRPSDVLSGNIDLSDMILIDASGDDVMKDSEDVRQDSDDLGKQRQGSGKKKKQDWDPYIAAKTKRLKGNPDRKKMMSKKPKTKMWRFQSIKKD